MKKALTLLVLGILLVIPLFITNPYTLHSFIMILLFAYLASAWNIVGGYAGQLSLGHASFLAIGAYTSTLFYTYLNLTPWIGMIVGGIFAALIAVLIGIPSFRLKGAYYSLATLAFAEGFRRLLESVHTVKGINFGGAEGIAVPLKMDAAFVDFQFLSKVPYYYIILFFLIAISTIIWWIENSKLGYYLTAIREDEEAAKALGINTRNVKLYAAGLSAFFTAIGGSFFAQLVRYLEPHSIAGFDLSAQMVFLAIIGGMSTVYGPTFGAFLLVALGEYLRASFSDIIPGLHLIIYGLAVILVILYYPKGVFVAIRDKFAKSSTGKKLNLMDYIPFSRRRKTDGTT